MSELTAEQRDKMPAHVFGLPGSREYPMPDAGHATFAKEMAAKEFEEGNLSHADKVRIDAKAGEILGEHEFKQGWDGAKG